MSSERLFADEQEADMIFGCQRSAGQCGTGDDKATTGPADGWPLPLSILADGSLDLEIRGGLRAQLPPPLCPGVKIEICPSFGKL